MNTVTEFSRQLRNNQIPEEKMLWEELQYWDFNILRFTNNEVVNGLTDVIEKMDNYLSAVAIN